MDNEAQIENPETIGMVVDIVSAYVANNAVIASHLPVLIADIHAAILGLGASPIAPEPEKKDPAVSIKKSVTPDYLISLEDGRQYKSLSGTSPALGSPLTLIGKNGACLRPIPWLLRRTLNSAQSSLNQWGSGASALHRSRNLR